MFPRKRRRVAAHVETEFVVDDAEMAAMAALSDWEVSLQQLWEEFPQSPNLPPLALHTQFYALLADRTEVDRAFHACRKTDRRVAVVHLPALGEDALVSADALAALLVRAAAAAAAPVAASTASAVGCARALELAGRFLVHRCRDAVLGSDLDAVYGQASAPASAAMLVTAGYLVARSVADEAARAWAWALPSLGGLSRELGAARRRAVAVLAKKTLPRTAHR
mmetsp:Transcript_6893/g.17977  ORF Transcript_6893/g.17977 Transcript_6893/m.17977 type:complete len:223 (-) Transcript_6893:353-1021(-)